MVTVDQASDGGAGGRGGQLGHAAGVIDPTGENDPFLKGSQLVSVVRSQVQDQSALEAEPVGLEPANVPRGCGESWPQMRSAAAQLVNSWPSPRSAVASASLRPGDESSSYRSSKDGWMCSADSTSSMDAPGGSEAEEQ